MSKSKRLMELMMTVNRKRRFKVRELAHEFGVSERTILRDLQELSELGVPLYSEVGPHGGYQVLNERVLPPIAFTEEEAAAMFFASHALRHYADLPFETEISSALGKFYRYMPGDVRDRIDQMKNRVDFETPVRHVHSPYLPVLLDAAVHQKVLLIEYESGEGTSKREIQPIGIYANNGLWYCPAYCFLRGDYRLFRCDRIQSAVHGQGGSEPKDLRHIHLGNRVALAQEEQELVRIQAELSRQGVRRCETELWHCVSSFQDCAGPALVVREDGTGRLDGSVPRREIPYFVRFFIGLGPEATVQGPPVLLSEMRRTLEEMLGKYRP
ncbi:WYL domain-containing protein [Cohnella sp. CFH 77786]|uniref:helix-turn-helix transcriptional regulator n=1 Tax=Cohnella sp. CFH 77786 TaxID=2662265 RepID=UPI001C6110F2|nr:YafY family protein [Cohnella sp. CFH 77786]MBW5449077.1 WYL domain-containing protein [Cohnella sp. CFH 77786]